MSNQEKAAQIGDAVLLCEEQKRNLAHLDEKIAKIKTAYRTFASQGERWGVDPGSSGKVYLHHPSAEERGLGSFLFSQSELAALILEHQEATAAIAETRLKLSGFGVTPC